MNHSTYWFDVSVNNAIFVHILDGSEHLLEKSKYVSLHELSGMALLVRRKVFTL